MVKSVIGYEFGTIDFYRKFNVNSSKFALYHTSFHIGYQCDGNIRINFDSHTQNMQIRQSKFFSRI